MIQLVVTYFNHQTMYYPVSPTQGWRIDAASRCIIIGKFPRQYVPLDKVANFWVEEVQDGTD